MLPLMSAPRTGRKIAAPKSMRSPTMVRPAGLVAGASASCGSAMPTPPMPIDFMP